MAFGVLLLIVVGLGACVSCCSVMGPPPTPHTMEETLYKAPIVVYAKHTQDQHFGPKYFQVYCAFKDVSGSITSRNITIPWTYLHNSCAGTHIEVGREYLIALKAVDDGMFAPAEPYLMEPAAFEPAYPTLRSIQRLCGLQNLTSLVEGKCPKADVPVFEKCVTAEYGSATSGTQKKG